MLVLPAPDGAEIMYNVPVLIAYSNFFMSSIITVSAFSDNYIWLVCNKKCDDKKQHGIIVDPGDPRQLIVILEKENITPIAVILTHLHYDHANGLTKLTNRYPNLPIYGPESEYKLLKDNPHPPTYGPATNCFEYITHFLKGDEVLEFKQVDCRFQLMSIPGHTSGHIAYYDAQNKRLFCGDTLFAGGCGRVFDGGFNNLHNSLQKIKALPEDTNIYCAHEYTLDNLGFAAWVEPENNDISARLDADRALIDNNQATVPSLLSLELKTNPFLRTDLAHVKERVEQATNKTLESPSEVFSAMRTWKDSKYD
ncbi:MAG TPA: hydroxyacylglutathione hydrolase [Leucothrix sp.]|nr:hydroxyacylglutathione hydrolase [Leucothrix sp.]